MENTLKYIAGHCGMVGSPILRKLEKEGFNNFVLSIKLFKIAAQN